MTDPRVQEILAKLTEPSRRLSWPERIMWCITTALVAITLLAVLLS